MTFDAAFKDANDDLDKQMIDIQKKMDLLVKKIGGKKAQWYLYEMLDYEFLLDLVNSFKKHKAKCYDEKMLMKSFYDLQERLSAQ